MKIDSHIWLMRGDFLKHSEMPLGIFVGKVKRKEIKRRSSPAFSVYRYIPTLHFYGKTPDKEIIEEGYERDKQIHEANKYKPNHWGGLKEENIAWLMTYAHERNMTVSEAIDRIVGMTKGMVDLKLWMSC